MKKLVIQCTGTEVYIGSHLTGEIKDYCKDKRAVFVADAALGIPDCIAIPNAKTEDTLKTLLDELFRKNVDRETVLIAVGGGAVTDLVGFAASIYMRGIDLILVPTTLLGMVDAAIGGKTGIDTPFGKNLIGTVYHPKAVFVDLAYLATLPEKEWQNGLAEIWKMGLIYDGAIFLKKRKDPELILQALQDKIAIIEQDPRDTSIRRILNFGHTIGHALEVMSGYVMSHGEAVAIGCLHEAHLSMTLGYLDESDFERVKEIFPPKPIRFDRQKFLDAITYDKKSKGGIPRFVLIDRIGHAIPFDGEYCKEVPIRELEEIINGL